MKKLSIIAVTLLAAGVVSSLAQTTGSLVFGPVPITFTGKLSNKASVTTDTLTGLVGGGTLEFAVVDFTGGSSTQQYAVIGTGIGQETVVSGSSTSVDLVGTYIFWSNDSVETDPAKKSATYVAAFSPIGFILGTNSASSYSIETNLWNGGISNSVLLVSSTVSDPSKGSKSTTNVTAKVYGIWDEFSNLALTSGSIKTGSPKATR